MGRAIRIPGLVLTAPTLPPVLDQPFGLAGAANWYNADSFAGAVGASVSGGWTDRVTGQATAVNSGSAKIATPLQADSRVAEFKSLEWSATTGDFGVDGMPTTDYTLAMVFGYIGGGSSKMFDLMGRKLTVSSSAFVLEPTASTSSVTKVQTPFSTRPRPSANRMGILVATLPADGAGTCRLTVRTSGGTTTTSGTVTKDAQTRLRLGPGSTGGGGNSAMIAEVGAFRRLLTESEVATVVDALQRRFGIA